MTPRELRRLCFDFRAARAVHAGVELGLFEALGREARSAKELAEHRGCEEHAIAIWLAAMAAIGIVERSGPAFRLTEGLVDALVPGGKSYVGNLLQHDLWHWNRWDTLDEVLRTGKPCPPLAADRYLSDPEVLRRFLPNYALAMAQSAGGAPLRLAALLCQRGADTVADFGGGNGGLLRIVCERMPESRGILIEHGFSLEAARADLAGSPALERIELCELDFERAERWPAYDAAVLSRVLMGFAAERAGRAIARVAAGLAPGGRLYVHDYDAASRVGALLGLDMLLNTGGEVHTGPAIVAWLGAAGLAFEEERRVLPYTRVWIGRKEVAA
jgi:SAM-dependent methyltransferase